MADEQDTGEKTEEPSAHRIEEFRKKGEVALSRELNSVLILSASLLTLGLTITFLYQEIATFVEWLYTLDVKSAYEAKAFKTIITKTIWMGLKITAPIFLVVICVSVLATVSQIGFLYSTEVLEFKLDKINPVKGFKRLFSIRSVVEAIKSVFKFIFILSIVYLFCKDDIFTYQGFLHLDIINSFEHSKIILLKLAFSIILGMGVIATFDLFYQKMSYKKKLMMTKQQAKMESKEKDGNPEIKQRIRQIQREISQRKMIGEIPTADVIVTNPTHISIALKYDPEKMISPMVIGKGADLLAMRIREIAKEHNIPMVENVPLARALYKTVKERQAVPREFYKAVAEVLAFVYKLKKKRKALHV